jgi:hypothetical protein
MRSLKFALALVLGIFGPGLSGVRASGFGLFRNLWGDVVVSTDTTRAGHALTPPTIEKPIYYLGKSLGCRLGSIQGDRLPDARKMTRLVVKILAKQGYLGATPGVHEPTLYLVVQWGYLEPWSGELLWFLGYDANKDIASPTFPGMLGAEVFRRDSRSLETQTILDDAGGAIYGIIVTAFEYKSSSTPNPIIYWQTRIGLPANGKSMEEALPTMLLAANTAIGHENESPVLRDADDLREGRAELGEFKVLGVVDDPSHGPESGGKK